MHPNLSSIFALKITHIYIYIYMDRCMDGRIDRWIEIDRWMDGRRDR